MFFFADIWWRIYITCWTTTLYSWWIYIIFTQGNTYCHYWQLTSLQGNLIEIRLLKKFSALYAQAGDAMYSTENVFRILIWTRLLCNVVPQCNEWEFHKCRPWLTWQRIPCTNTGLVTIFFNPSTTLKVVFSSPDPKGQVSYCHHLASVVVVRRKLFQKSSPLKVLDQWKPNLVWIITRVSKLCPVMLCTNQHGRCY